MSRVDGYLWTLILCIIPNPIKRETKLLPPYETKSKGIPITGRIPKFIPVFIKI